MGTKFFSTATITAVLTAAFVTPAGAQSLGGVTNGPQARTYAQEQFGPNSGSVRLNMDATTPALTSPTVAERTPATIRIIYAAGTTAIPQDSYADITFRFSGAVLAEPIARGDFILRANSNNAPQNNQFTFGPNPNGAGGTKGDAFVSYRVTAVSGGGTLAANHFNFLIPDLDMVSVAGEEDADDRVVTVTVSVDPPASSPFSSVTTGFAKFPPTGTNNVVTVATIEPAFTLTIDPSSTSMGENSGAINLNDPTMLASTSTAPLLQVSGFGDEAMSGLRISTVTLNDMTGHQLLVDGSAVFTAGTTDMLRVAATGNFAASDRLFLGPMTAGTTATYNEDRDTLLTISSDGTSAEAAIPLAGTGNIPTGSSRTLYYVPGGGEIRRGAIGSTYTLDFAAATAMDSTAPSKDLTLEYNGISFTNYAYAIPGPNAADAGNLRVRCEGASDCVVFFRCMDQAGMNVGGFERTNIEAGSVEHISSMELATMLGVDDWSGRLSCTLHSSSRVAVQLLVRSGGVLTNNTFIGGLDATQ